MKRRISAGKCVIFHMRTLPLLYLCSSRLYLRQLRRIAVLQLIFAYIAVMLTSSLTVGCADCVHKYLALILMWYFRKRIKVIVIVIVQHHKAVVFSSSLSNVGRSLICLQVEEIIFIFG